MKRALNDFGAFDAKPTEKRWRFRLKSDAAGEWRWEGLAPDWFSARHAAASELGQEPTQLIGEQVE